jgi:hypothetical protein
VGRRTTAEDEEAAFQLGCFLISDHRCRAPQSSPFFDSIDPKLPSALQFRNVPTTTASEGLTRNCENGTLRNIGGVEPYS